MPRITPYRSGSNHNLLVHDNDPTIRDTMIRLNSKKKAILYDNNGLYIGFQKGQEHAYLQERRKEAKERMARGIEDNFEEDLIQHLDGVVERMEGRTIIQTARIGDVDAQN